MTIDPWVPSFPARRPRIAAIGLASWDHLIVVDRYPPPGTYAVVRQELSAPGGTTTNAVAALAKLGAQVAIRALVGDDDNGRALRMNLDAIGVETTWLTTATGRPTDAGTIIVSGDPPERTIFWRQGARLVRGDQMDVAALFSHDIVLIDVDDPPLRRFLLDLPAHTLPGARLLGTLTYLEESSIPDAFDLLMRHDVAFGNERQLKAITGSVDLDGAISAARSRMRGENLRTVVITRGAEGAIAFTIDEIWDEPAFEVEIVDSTGAGDAFAGAVAFGMACRWQWPATLRFANAVAALTTTALGAQTAQPDWDQAVALLGSST